MAIIYWVKNRLEQKGRLWVNEILNLEVIFVTLIENSSVATNDIQACQKYPLQWKKL